MWNASETSSAFDLAPKWRPGPSSAACIRARLTTLDPRVRSDPDPCCCRPALVGRGLVSSEWRPDDSLLERGENDEVRGTRRVKDALEKHGIRYGDRVITSRDKGMDEVKGDLKRSGMPPGVEQWQVPIVVKPSGEALSFTGRMEAGAEVPEHVHKHPVFRIVIEGSLEYGDLTLKPGDWMFVPAGQAYSLKAGPEGFSTFYHPGTGQLMILEGLTPACRMRREAVETPRSNLPTLRAGFA